MRDDEAKETTMSGGNANVTVNSTEVDAVNSTEIRELLAHPETQAGLRHLFQTYARTKTPHSSFRPSGSNGIGLADFVEFGDGCGLLRATELALLFRRSSKEGISSSGVLPVLSFDEFVDAISRCALSLSRKHSLEHASKTPTSGAAAITQSLTSLGVYLPERQRASRGSFAESSARRLENIASAPMRTLFEQQHCFFASDLQTDANNTSSYVDGALNDRAAMQSSPSLPSPDARDRLPSGPEPPTRSPSSFVLRSVFGENGKLSSDHLVDSGISSRRQMSSPMRKLDGSAISMASHLSRTGDEIEYDISADGVIGSSPTSASPRLGTLIAPVAEEFSMTNECLTDLDLGESHALITCSDQQTSKKVENARTLDIRSGIADMRLETQNGAAPVSSPSLFDRASHHLNSLEQICPGSSEKYERYTASSHSDCVLRVPAIMLALRRLCNEMLTKITDGSAPEAELMRFLRVRVLPVVARYLSRIELPPIDSEIALSAKQAVELIVQQSQSFSGLKPKAVQDADSPSSQPSSTASALVSLSSLLSGKVPLHSKCACEGLSWLVRATLNCGTAGVAYLASSLGDGLNNNDMVALADLVRHPAVHREVVIPMLLKEMVHPSVVRRNEAVIALGTMSMGGTESLPVNAALERALWSGTSNRPLAAWALRCTGSSGEDVLLRAARCAQHSARVRECSCWSLGIPLPSLCVHATDCGKSANRVQTSSISSNALSTPALSFRVCKGLDFTTARASAPPLRLRFRSCEALSCYSPDVSLATSVLQELSKLGFWDPMYFGGISNPYWLPRLELIIEARELLSGIRQALASGSEFSSRELFPANCTSSEATIKISDHGLRRTILATKPASLRARAASDVDLRHRHSWAISGEATTNDDEPKRGDEGEFARERVCAIRRDAMRNDHSRVNAVTLALDSGLQSGLQFSAEEYRVLMPDHFSFGKNAVAGKYFTPPSYASIETLVTILSSASNVATERDPVVRTAAARSLGSLGSLFSSHDSVLFSESNVSRECKGSKPNVALALLGATWDRDFRVRGAAVSALGDIALPALDDKRKIAIRAIASRVVELLSDQRWKVRFLATVALGKIGAAAFTSFQDPVKALVGTMCKGLNKHCIAGHVLARLGPQGHTMLINMCRGDKVPMQSVSNSSSSRFFRPSSQMRAAAAFGLGFLPLKSDLIEKCVEVLYDIAYLDSVPTVRAAGLCALGRLSRDASEQVLLLRVRTLHPELYRALADSAELVRNTAAELLAEAGVEGELLLVEALQRDSSAIVRTAAIRGLMLLGPRSFRSLLHGLRDRDSDVRASAGEALTRIGVQSLAETAKRFHKSSVRHEVRALLSPVSADLGIAVRTLLRSLAALLDDDMA